MSFRCVIGNSQYMRSVQHSPTLGAHTHAHPCPWVLGGHGCDVIVHGWAWVAISFVHPCIQLQIGVKLLGCREYANQEASCFTNNCDIGNLDILDH